jgi:hypothetical protein
VIDEEFYARFSAFGGRKEIPSPSLPSPTRATAASGRISTTASSSLSRSAGAEQLRAKRPASDAPSPSDPHSAKPAPGQVPALLLLVHTNMFSSCSSHFFFFFFARVAAGKEA